MVFWQFKIRMKNWAEGSDSEEYNNLFIGNIFEQYVKANKKQMANNIGDIVFHYNSKKTKKYSLGIYLISKIISTIDENFMIKLEVIKDLRAEPYDYQNDFSEIFDYYNTTKIKGRSQSIEKIAPEYHPTNLYHNVLTNELTNQYPDELNIADLHMIPEGAKKQIVVNYYERNKVARKKCLEKFGYNCFVCNINFKNIYGEIGKNFIHVHHLTELSTVKKNYKINPIQDLRPVCPNCHAMLHRKKPAYSINGLKEIIDNKSQIYGV